VHLKSGLIREVTSIEGTINSYFTISVHLKSGLIREVTSIEGTINSYFTISVHLKSGLIRDVALGGIDLIKVVLLYYIYFLNIW
jgi:hypothetical protein